MEASLDFPPEEDQKRTEAPTHLDDRDYLRLKGRNMYCPGMPKTPSAPWQSSSARLQPLVYEHGEKQKY